VTTEAEYKKTVKVVGKQIDEKVDLATKLLLEAEALANEHGVPFYSSVSALGQHYIPNNLKETTGLSMETIAEITGVSEYTLDDSYGGWEHSAVC
jgi:hypothetical protein